MDKPEGLEEVRNRLQTELSDKFGEEAVHVATAYGMDGMDRQVKWRLFIFSDRRDIGRQIPVDYEGYPLSYKGSLPVAAPARR